MERKPHLKVFVVFAVAAHLFRGVLSRWCVQEINSGEEWLIVNEERKWPANDVYATNSLSYERKLF